MQCAGCPSLPARPLSFKEDEISTITYSKCITVECTTVACTTVAVTNLAVSDQGFRHSVVDDVTHILLVNSHAKCNCGNYNLDVASKPCILHLQLIVRNGILTTQRMSNETGTFVITLSFVSLSSEELYAAAGIR